VTGTEVGGQLSGRGGQSVPLSRAVRARSTTSSSQWSGDGRHLATGGRTTLSHQHGQHTDRQRPAAAAAAASAGATTTTWTGVFTETKGVRRRQPAPHRRYQVHSTSAARPVVLKLTVNVVTLTGGRANAVFCDNTAVLSKKAVSAFFAQNELLPPGDCVRHYLTVCKARKP